MDSAGEAPPLTDDVLFYRRIWPHWIHIQPERDPPMRPGSVAFKDGHREVSLFRADLTTAEAILSGYPDHSLVAVDYGTIRSLGLSVEPRPDEGGAAHYILIPYPTGSKSTRLAKAAKWVRRGRLPASAEDANTSAT